MLETLRRQVYRYEISFFSPGAERLEKSVSLHRSIMDALDEGKLSAATRRIEEHWRADLDSLAPDVSPGTKEPG